MNFKWGEIYLKLSSVHSLYMHSSPVWLPALHHTTHVPPPPCLAVSGLVSAEVAAVTRPPAAIHALLTTTATHLTRTWVGATWPPGLLVTWPQSAVNGRLGRYQHCHQHADPGPAGLGPRAVMFSSSKYFLRLL